MRYTPLIAAALMVAPTAVSAQGAVCGDTHQIIQALGSNGEVPISAATNSAGEVVILTVSPDGRWSMLISSPDGVRACFAATGENWSRIMQGEPA